MSRKSVPKSGARSRPSVGAITSAEVVAPESGLPARRTARKPVTSDPSSVRLVGYARVSTDAQTTALQLDALHAAGCVVIHEEAASGATRARPGLDRAIADLRRGDTLVVWRLDRLGRSLRDLLDIAEALRERDVALRSLTDQLDTSTAAGRMLYAVLGAVAQFERDVLRERTVAGLTAAKRRGERLGRRPALTPAQVAQARKMIADGDPVRHVAHVLRVGRSTVYRHLINES